MSILSEIIKTEESYIALKSSVDGGRCPALCTGVGSVHAANILAAMIEDMGMPVAVVCSDEAEAARLSADIEGFCGARGDVLSSRDMVFYSAEGVSRQSEHRRLQTMYSIASGKNELVFCTIDSLLQRSIPEERLTS